MHRIIIRKHLFIFFLCSTQADSLLAMQCSTDICEEISLLIAHENLPVHEDPPDADSSTESIPEKSQPEPREPLPEPTEIAQPTGQTIPDNWEKELAYAVAIMVMQRNELDNLGEKNKNLKQYLLTERAVKKRQGLIYFQAMNRLWLTDKQSRQQKTQSQQEPTPPESAYTTAAPAPPQPALRRTKSYTSLSPADTHT